MQYHIHHIIAHLAMLTAGVSLAQLSHTLYLNAPLSFGGYCTLALTCWLVTIRCMRAREAQVETDISKLFERIAEDVDETIDAPRVHIHGDVAHVVNIKLFAGGSLHLHAVKNCHPKPTTD